MPKLFELFGENRNLDFNHSEAVAKLIHDEGVDINSVDEDGNTILHLMVINRVLHYHALKKIYTDPNFKQSTGHTGNYYGSWYKGPAFYDDLSTFLGMGADIRIKNKQGFTHLDLFLADGRLWRLDPNDLIDYFGVILLHYPDFIFLKRIIEEIGTTPDAGYQNVGNERVKKEVYLLNTTFLSVFSLKLLSLQCLQDFQAWINNRGLLKLGLTEENNLKLLAAINLQIHELDKMDILEGIKLIIHFYKEEKDFFIRSLLLDETFRLTFTQYFEYNYLKEIVQDEDIEILSEINTEFKHVLPVLLRFNVGLDELNTDEKEKINKVCKKLESFWVDKGLNKAWISFPNRSDNLRREMSNRFLLFSREAKPQMDLVVRDICNSEKLRIKNSF